MKKGVFLAKDVATIVCPVEGSNTGPVIVQVAKTARSKASVALPSLAKKPKTAMTYFTVFPEQPESVTENNGRTDEPGMPLISGTGLPTKTNNSFLHLISFIVFRCIMKQ